MLYTNIMNKTPVYMLYFALYATKANKMYKDTPPHPDTPQDVPNLPFQKIFFQILFFYFFITFFSYFLC